MALPAQGFVGKTRQREHYWTYTPGDCSCGNCSEWSTYEKCGGLDWFYEDTECCHGFCRNQRHCSRLKPGICPVIGGVTPSQQWDPAESQQDRPTDSKGVLCTYGTQAFLKNPQGNPPQGGQALAQWVKHFGKDNTYNTQIMPWFCAEPLDPSFEPASEVCPKDPATGQRMTTCSHFSATNDSGNWCRQWATEQEQQHPNTRTLADEAKEKYCRTFPDSPDCACLARSYNSIYQQLKAGITRSAGGQVLPDQCWWAPCANPSVYLVTSDLAVKPGTCPETVCQAVQNFVDSENIDLRDVQQNISCNLVGRAPPPPSPPAGEQTGVPSDAGEVAKGPLGVPLWLWIVVPLVVVAVAAVAAIVYIWYVRRRQSKEPEPESATS